MRALLISLAIAACTDEQNVGNTPPPPTPLSSPRWALSFGDAGADDAWSVAVADNGDVVAAGTIHGVVDFGAHTLDATLVPSRQLGVLTRRASDDGRDLWTIGFDSNFAVNPQLVASGPASTIIALGWMWDIGVKKAELVAYYDTGGQMWRQPLSAHATATSLAVASDGRIAVAGSTDGDLDIATAPVDTGYPQAFVEMFAADGTPLWAVVTQKLGPAPTIDTLAFTGDGALLVAGTFAGTFTIGGIGIVPPDSANAPHDAFAASLGSNGRALWAHPIGDPTHDQYPTNIAIGPDGTAIIASTTRCANCSYSAPLVQRLDASGAIASSLSPTWGIANSVVLAAGDDDTLYASGITNGLDIDLGGGLISASAYLAAFAPDGALIQAIGLGARETGGCQLRAIATRGNTLAAAGRIGQAIDLGDVPLAYAGNADLLIAAYDIP